jgi:four helix bundle protein
VTLKIDIYDRVFKFATRVAKMHQTLTHDRTISRNALNQVINSSSSIGSNLEEAKAAQSKALTFMRNCASL